MKKITSFIITFSFLLLMSCAKSDQEENQIQTPVLTCLSINLQNGVVAQYSFGNGSLNDSSGNNYNLTNSTSANSGIDRAGNPNCAFNFNETDFLEYVNPTFLNNLPSTNLSVSFWCKPEEFGAGTFISRDANSCPYNNGQWAVRFVNGFIQFIVNGGRIVTSQVTLNTWQHIVITSNSTSFQIYIDGVLKVSSSDFSFCPTMSATPTTANLLLGKNFDGLLDDVVIYNRILTPTEVTELYNLVPCCN